MPSQLSLAENKDLKECLLQHFRNLEAVKYAKPGEEFTLRSGRKSNIYLDCRRVVLDSEAMRDVSQLMLWDIFDHANYLEDTYREKRFIYLGGVGVGACPLLGGLVAFAGHMRIPAVQGFVVREVDKAHGLGNKIEGHVGEDNGHVFIVEDVVTSGDSVFNAVGALATIGLKPDAVFTIVDRGEGGKEALATVGIPLFSLLTLGDFDHDPVREGRCDEPAGQRV